MLVFWRLIRPQTQHYMHLCMWVIFNKLHEVYQVSRYGKNLEEGSLLVIVKDLGGVRIQASWWQVSYICYQCTKIVCFTYHITHVHLHYEHIYEFFYNIFKRKVGITLGLISNICKHTTIIGCCQLKWGVQGQLKRGVLGQHI